MTFAPATSHSSGYASIMVPLNLGEGAGDRVRLAATLSDRFGSRLIGIAAEDVILPYVEGGMAAFDATLYEEAKRTVGENLAKAEMVFRRAAGSTNNIDWRCKIGEPRRFVLTQARAADILLIARQASDDPPQGAMTLSPGELVMELGRPLIVVPPHVTDLSAKHIVIAWKNTREARRAVWDSLPLLRRAEAVAVLSVGPEAESQGTRDVGDYLALHGVASRAVILSTSTKSAIDELIDFTLENGSDLIVSGAYGHSRMREWLFGGMTHELLQSSPVCCLMSH